MVGLDVSDVSIWRSISGCLGCWVGCISVQIEYVHFHFYYYVRKLLALNLLLLKLNFSLHGEALIWGCGAVAPTDAVDMVGGRASNRIWMRAPTWSGVTACCLIVSISFPLFSDFYIVFMFVLFFAGLEFFEANLGAPVWAFSIDRVVFGLLMRDGFTFLWSLLLLCMVL